MMNLPAVKTEPRDTSPQPSGIYRNLPELTPSPQPLSPSGAYAQTSPSPYNMATTLPAGAQNRQQYNITDGAAGVNNAPTRMAINEYNTFSQQVQQQQQQYQVNNFGGAGTELWDTKFNPAPPARNNLSNFHSTNPFAMHNLLPPTNGTGSVVNGSNSTGWNITSNHFNPQQHPHQYPQSSLREAAITNNNDNLANTAGAVPNANNVSSANHTEHGLSNLLRIDSEQYVRINSEDQQMLRLNSEDLQISNLSIST